MTAAADDFYFPTVAVITIAGAGGTPASKTLAVAKNVKAIWKSKEAKAYGMGSNLIQTKARYEFEVEVSIGFIKFAPKVVEWFPFWITDPVAGGGTVTDTNTVMLFTLTAQINPLTASGTKWLRSITGISFPEFPMEVPNTTDWIPVNLKGSGITLVDTNP
jgi:hypothetical protein